MRDALKSHGLAQSLVFPHQLAEFSVPKSAQGHGDGGQQQKGASREITFLAAL
jgi:hypothetical protein